MYTVKELAAMLSHDGWEVQPYVTRDGKWVPQTTIDENHGDFAAAGGAK